MSRRVCFVLLITLTILSATLAGLGSVRGVQKVTVRLATSTDARNLTPYTFIFGYPDLCLVNLIYDALFWPDPNNIPQPWLVKSFEVSPDGKKWVLRLHDGVKWHDGKPLTSEDVRFTFEYVKKFKITWTPQLASVDRVVANDTTTTTVFLKAFSAPFLLQPLASMPILPRHIWETVTDPRKFTGLPVGSGPYKLVEYVPDQFYRFQANTEYFKGKPTVDEIAVPIIKEASTMFLALKTGEVDAVTRSISPEVVAELEKIPEIKILRGPGFSTTLLQFNNERPPFTVKEFRKAISLAVDRSRLIEILLQGFGTQGSPGFIHPASPWYNPKVKPEVSVSKAKELMDSIQFVDRDKDGVRETPDGKKLEFTLLVYSTDPVRIRAAEIISLWLKDLAIRVNVKTLDPVTVDSLVWPEFDVAKGRDFDMTMWGWSPGIQLDPDSLRRLFHSSTDAGYYNVGAYRNRDFDKLAEEQVVTVDSLKRKEIVLRLQEIVAEDVPMVTCYYLDGLYGVRPKTYDGWVYVKGTGILDKLSFMAPAPPTPPPSAPPIISPLIIAVIIIAAIATAAAIAYLKRTRKPAP